MRSRAASTSRSRAFCAEAEAPPIRNTPSAAACPARRQLILRE